MKKITFLLACLFIAFGASAQKTDAMLFGHVIDKTTKKHIPYASILVKGFNRGTATDASGHFKMANLPLGKQIAVAQLVGYKPQEIEVFMEKGKATQVFFELEEDALNLEQVVVTGTRTQHYVKDVPIRTEVVTAQALKNKNAWNIFEALEGTPGIRVESQCQFCNFSMVRMQGLGAEHTQVLINGQPIYSGLASVYGLEQIGTGDVDRIEVVKGAGSALYGSSAVAGAINIITKEPSASPSISANLQAGNHGSKNYNLTASMRNDNIGLNIYAQRIEHGVIDATGEGETRDEVKKKDGISDRVESKLNNLGFGLFVYHPFFEKDKLIIRGKAITEKRAGGTITDDMFRNPYTEGTENIETNRHDAELTYAMPVGENSEFNLSAAYVNHHRQATNDSFLGDYKKTHNDEKPDVEMMRPYIAKENSFTPSVSFSSKLGSHNLLIGAQGYFTRLNESGLYTIVDKKSAYVGTAYKSTGKKHAKEFGAFIQDEWNVSPRFTVVPGIRVDYHSSGESYESDKKVFDSAFPDTKFNETSVNPRLALKYVLMRNVTLRANFGTGFRAPYGFSEDLHLCSGSPRVWKSSENLKGEKSYSYNVSADYYGNHLQMSANLFRTNLKNKIDFSPADDKVKALGYTYQWENVDDAYVQGIELSILANIARNLNVGADVTFNQGKYKHNRDDWKKTSYAEISRNISRFPATTGNLKIEYTPSAWTFTLTGAYQGKMYIDYMKDDEKPIKIKETSPFMTFNGRVSKSFNHIFNVYAGANNIFGYIQDEKHLDNAAFIYAPLYGTLCYAGISINISH